MIEVVLFKSNSRTENNTSTKYKGLWILWKIHGEKTPTISI